MYPIFTNLILYEGKALNSYNIEAKNWDAPW
jgi:hypothetical protein